MVVRSERVLKRFNRLVFEVRALVTHPGMTHSKRGKPLEKTRESGVHIRSFSQQQPNELGRIVLDHQHVRLIYIAGPMHK